MNKLIKQKRKFLGITRKFLSDKTGINYRILCNLENGLTRLKPKINIRHKYLLKILKINLDNLDNIQEQIIDRLKADIDNDGKIDQNFDFEIFTDRIIACNIDVYIYHFGKKIELKGNAYEQEEGSIKIRYQITDITLVDLESRKEITNKVDIYEIEKAIAIDENY